MKFILDSNLSPFLARALSALCAPNGDTVEHVRDKFPNNPTDVEWINELAKEGDWIIVSQDRFYKNTLEKEALRLTGLTVFVLKKSWAEQEHWEKASRLIRWWPRIMKQADLVTGGAIFEVPYRFSGKGRFEQIRL